MKKRIGTISTKRNVEKYVICLTRCILVVSNYETLIPPDIGACRGKNSTKRIRIWAWIRKFVRDKLKEREKQEGKTRRKKK